MLIHPPTALLVVFIGISMLAVVLSLSGSQVRALPELRAWNIGNFLLIGALVVLALYPSLPNVPAKLSSFASHWMLMGGAAWYGNALYQAVHGRSAPKALWQALALALALSTLTYGMPSAQRTSVFSVWLAVFYLPGIWQALRYGGRLQVALRTAGLALAVAALALLGRAALVLAPPAEYAAPLQDATPQALAFLVTLGGVLGAGMAFVTAALGRSVNQHQALASTDPLTGCLNRRAADVLLDNALQRALRSHESTSMVMLELDHFKTLNDRHGHRVADEILRRFAQTARARLRASDTLARLGGDEFALILPSTDAIGAVHVAESVRAAMEGLSMGEPKDGSPAVTVSAGIACVAGIRTEMATAQQLYDQASSALQAAKAAGHNRIELAADL